MNDKIAMRWNKIATDMLVGRKIVSAVYMDKDEAAVFGWNQRALIIQLDDGNLLIPSADDEGNGPGALFTNNDENPVLPVL